MNPKILIKKPAFNRLNIFTQIFLLIFLLFLPNLSFSQDLNPKSEKGPKKWLGIEFNRPTNNSLSNTQNDLIKRFIMGWFYAFWSLIMAYTRNVEGSGGSFTFSQYVIQSPISMVNYCWTFSLIRLN